MAVWALTYIICTRFTSCSTWRSLHTLPKWLQKLVDVFATAFPELGLSTSPGHDSSKQVHPASDPASAAAHSMPRLHDPGSFKAVMCWQTFILDARADHLALSHVYVVVGNGLMLQLHWYPYEAGSAASVTQWRPPQACART